VSKQEKELTAQLAHVEMRCDLIVRHLESRRKLRSRSTIENLCDETGDLRARVKALQSENIDWLSGLLFAGAEILRLLHEQLEFIQRTWCEGDVDTSTIRVNELLRTLGVRNGTGKSEPRDILKLQKEHAAELGAETLPPHASKLRAWGFQLDSASKSAKVNTSLYLGEVGISIEEAKQYLHELRPTLAESTCKKIVSKELKHPKYRTSDGKRIKKAALEEYAKEAESKAILKEDKKLKKQRTTPGKNYPNVRF